MSTPASYLPLAEQDFPSEHAALAQAFHTRATWLWTHEDEPYQPPYAPPGAERGFRWTYTSTLPSRAPSSITIVISVDNYFALHVNGALVHVADSRDEFWDAFAFTVPIAAGSTKTVVAVRGVNADDTGAVLNNPAGFTAAIKISFQGTTETETFVTGPNMQWVGESSLPVGWENPEFNDSSWPNVVVYPIEHVGSYWSPDYRRGPSKLFVGSSITGGTTTTTATRTSTLVVTSSSSSLTTTSTTLSQLSTSNTPSPTSSTPDILDPLPQDPTLAQGSTGATGVGSSNNISNSNGSMGLGPPPFMSGIIVGFILLFTLWPRSMRRIY